MIKFHCSHCNHRISAADNYAGKSARCPKCNQPVHIPLAQQEPNEQKPELIKFRCAECNQKIGVPLNYAGKRVRCRKCNGLNIVPQFQKHETPNQPERLSSPDSGRSLLMENRQTNTNDLLALSVGPTIELEKPKVNEEEFQDNRVAKPLCSRPSEEVQKRKLPWPIDILLYPVSGCGLFNVALIVVGQYVALLFCVFSFLIQLMLTLFMYWYYCECIRDSAAGNLRAPMIFASSRELFDEFLQNLKLIVCCLFFIAPFMIYSGYCLTSGTKPNVVITFSLISYTIFFLPMGLLAMIMFDSISALNPILLIRSIISTFPQYCGLILLVYGLYALFFYGIAGVNATSEATPETLFSATGILRSIAIAIVTRTAFLWLLFVQAHLLGRFYWKYQEKLYWEV